MLGTNTKHETKNRGTRYSHTISFRGLIHGDSSKNDAQSGRTTYMRTKGYTKVS